MSHDHILDRLSDYLDGELDRADSEAIRIHLDGCAGCQAVADDLAQIAHAGATLPDLPPTRELWTGIESRIRGEQVLPFRPRNLRPAMRRWGGLVAAGVVVGAVAGGTALLVNRMGGTPSPTPVAVIAPAPADPVRQVSTSEQLSRSTGAAVSQLEQLLMSDSAQLDTATVRVLSLNLARIDSAIADAERALVADPSNAYVSRHLAATTKRKIDLLRRVAVLAQSRS